MKRRFRWLLFWFIITFLCMKKFEFELDSLFQFNHNSISIVYFKEKLRVSKINLWYDD